MTSINRKTLINRSINKRRKRKHGEIYNFKQSQNNNDMSQVHSAAACPCNTVVTGYLIRSFSIASASNLTGFLSSSNDDAFFTIKRNVQTCSF